MDTRISRINSNQTGEYTISNNVVSVTIPAGQVVDLSKSYLEITMRVPVVDGQPSSGNGVYNVQLAYGANFSNPIYNTSLIKNCRLSSQNQGLLEEINEVNVLTTNLKQMQESRSERLGNSYKSLNQVYDKNQQKWNIFREFNATGAASSREKIARVPIMLSELFGLGRVQALDLRKTGDLRVEVELDISQISAEIIGDGDAVETDPEPLVGDGAPITTLNVFGYEVLDDSPFWVGQKVKYTSGTITSPTKPDVETYTTIKSITRTSGGSSNVLDQLTIEFNDALDTMAVGQEAANPELTPQVLDVDGQANTVSVKFDQVEMVLHQLLDNTPRNEDILYLTYDTEQANGNNNVNYQDQFILPPTCVNSVWCFTLPDGTQLDSINNNITSYRLRVDNVNQTDRRVEFHSPLYYEELVKMSLNMDDQLKNLSPVTNAGENDFIAAENQTDRDMVVLPLTTPITAGNKIVQVSVKGDNTGVQNIICFKQIQKSL